MGSFARIAIVSLLVVSPVFAVSPAMAPLPPVSAVSAGNITDTLMYRNLARDTRDIAFLFQIDLGNARIALTRAEYEFAIEERLSQTRSTSEFARTDAELTLIQSRFNVSRGIANVDYAQTEAKAWDLRADATEGKKISLKELAQLYVGLRTRHLELAKTLLTAAEPFAKGLRNKADAAERLLGEHAMAAEEENGLHLAAKEGAELLEAARLRVTDAQKELQLAIAEAAKVSE